MALLSSSPYKVREFDLHGLSGISDKTLEIHFGLYGGYVKNTNLLTEQLISLSEKGKFGTLEYAEATRRLPFEYNGMVLHELYFGNMQKEGGGAEINSSSALGRAIGESFGVIDVWKKDFAAISAMRGVGWVVLYEGPATGKLSNQWITLRQDGNIAGFRPLLVMDVWEHAFLLDYKPADRPRYVEAFLNHLNLQEVEGRLNGNAQRAVGV